MNNAKYDVRMQVSLTSDQVAMAKKLKKSLSLSGYMRQALSEKINRDKQAQTSQKMADVLPEPLPGPPPKIKDLLEFERELRQDRPDPHS